MGTFKLKSNIGMLKHRFYNTVSKYINNFALTKEELTEAQVEPFKIELNDHTPCFEKPMRYNKTLTNCINKEVNSLLEKKLIYPSNSSYAAKVIMAPKGEGWRMCLNYV